MPVPSAVAKRREALQSKLDAEEAARVAASQNNGQSPAPPVGDEPRLAPVIPTAELRTDLAIAKNDAQNGGDIAAVLKRMDEMQAKFDSEHGRLVTMQATIETQTEQLRVAEQNRIFLEGKLQEQAEALRAAQAGAVRNKASEALAVLDTPDLTQDQIDNFDPENLKVVAGLSAAQLKKLKPLFEAFESRIAELEQNVTAHSGVATRFQEVESTVQANAEAQARLAEKNFWVDSFKDTAHKDFQEFTKTQPWMTLMHKEVPGMPNVKYAALVQSYQKSRNVAGMIGVFDIFKHENKQRTSLTDLATPAATTASQLPKSPETKPTYKTSDYRTQLNEFNKKRLSSEDWQKFKTSYLEAQKEGRLLPG